ncbi:MAG TPA: GNAT family N-acetyltransferase [Anaerolineales bacterium]|nr:GNAT family N-acetyltransferase [Anaerolineae bacterium]HIQ02123.1 GNAT family N-acetyltransferase [Anaerolineales bacterium]
MHVRKARPADLEACLRLDHSVVTDYAWRMEEREHDGAITVTFRPVRLPRQMRLPYPRRGEELAAGWEGCDLFLVGSVDGRVCGYVAAHSLPGHGLVWVQDLVIDPARRRQGCGSRLLQEIASWGVDQGLQRLVVEVQTRNHPGVCFCRALGFSFCGYHDRHWRTQDIALLFGLNLR